VTQLSRGSSSSSARIGRLGALAWLGCVLCGAALAQTVALDATPPSRAQVLKLMSAMGVQQSVDQSLRTTQQKVKAAARAAFEKKDPGADAATLKKLDEVFDSTPLFTFDDVAEAIVPVYQKNLSAGDVQAGIDFYSSEAGKRLLEKVPEIIREANEQGGQLVQKKLQAYSEELERKLEAFESEVNPRKPPEAPQSKAANDASKDGKSK
jgi:uncharacterized protein